MKDYLINYFPSIVKSLAYFQMNKPLTILHQQHLVSIFSYWTIYPLVYYEIAKNKNIIIYIKVKINRIFKIF